jgi:serine/threonine-protein kinase
VPEGHGLALGVGGTALQQMSVFAADGSLLAAKGALRVVTIPVQRSSPVQLLVTNEGVAPTRISLSLRADPPPPSAVPEPPAPGDAPPPPLLERSAEPGGAEGTPPREQPAAGVQGSGEAGASPEAGSAGAEGSPPR